MTIDLPLFQEADQRPDDWALVDARQTLNWSEVSDAVLRIAGAMNLAPDKARPIAVCAHNAAEVVLAHAAALIGCVPVVPLSHHLAEEELAYILRDADCRLVLVGPETADKVKSAIKGLPDIRIRGWRTAAVESFERWIAEPPAFIPDPDAPPAANLMYTSGTTGRPKGAVGTSRVLTPSLGENCAGRLVATRAHLVAGPLYHGGPMNGSMHICAGVEVVVLDRFEPIAALEAIQTYRVGSSTMVPTR